MNYIKRLPQMENAAYADTLHNPIVTQTLEIIRYLIVGQVLHRRLREPERHPAPVGSTFG